MFKFIERLRTEPESHRKRTAIIIALSFTGIIFSAWFMAVSAGSPVTYNQNADTATSSPVAAVGDAVKTGAALIGDIIDTFRQSKAIIFEAASSTTATIAITATTTVATSTPN